MGEPSARKIEEEMNMTQKRLRFYQMGDKYFTGNGRFMFGNLGDLNDYLSGAYTKRHQRKDSDIIPMGKGRFKFKKGKKGTIWGR